jgi:aryl-alcohol dehydrogenase-like predicted oxidoreductase
VRYIDASSGYAWECPRVDRFGEARLGGIRVNADHHNPVCREEEREMIPLCIEEPCQPHSVRGH